MPPTERPHLYLLGPRHSLIPMTDVLEWARGFEKLDNVLIQTKVGETLVSTVFLGVDYGNGPPIVFETMTFPDKGKGITERYSTWAQARRGHDRIVREVRNG